MANPNCPSREALASYLRGKLALQQAVVKQHVSRCPDCAAVIHHFWDYAKSQAVAAGMINNQPVRSSKAAPFAVVGVVAAAVLALGSWLVIRDQDGSEVARAEMPDGGYVEIKPSASAFQSSLPPAAPSPSRTLQPVVSPSDSAVPSTPPAATPSSVANAPAAPASSASSAAFVPPAGSKLGLIGRLSTTQDGDYTDASVLLVYTPGKILTHAVVTQPVSPVTEPMIQQKAIRVLLGGLLHVPRDMDVAVWHAGGSSTRGNAYLYIDGREIGVVGDDRTKNINYRVPLKAGEHIVGWHLVGGQLGNSLVAFYDPESRAELTVYAPPGLVKTQQIPATKKQLDLNADGPLPPRPPNMLEPAPTPSSTARP